MFDAIIQFVKDIWTDYLQFWIYVPQYREAIILRNGAFHRLKTAGFHWKWPTYEEEFQALIIPTTHDLRSQSLVTKDGKTVTVRGMVKSKVSDTKKFLLEVYDQLDALGDTTMGVIANIVNDSTYEELLGIDIDNKITVKARVQAKKYGIEVIQVTLIDKTPSRALRLFGESKAEEILKT